MAAVRVADIFVENILFVVYFRSSLVTVVVTFPVLAQLQLQCGRIGESQTYFRCKLYIFIFLLCN